MLFLIAAIATILIVAIQFEFLILVGRLDRIERRLDHIQPEDRND